MYVALDIANNERPISSNLIRTHFLMSRAISPELHTELTKGNRQVCWRFLRRLFKLFEAGVGLNLEEVERIFQLCAASDEEFLQVRQKQAKIKNHRQTCMLIRDSRVIINVTMELLYARGAVHMDKILLKRAPMDCAEILHVYDDVICAREGMANEMHANSCF